MARKLIVEILGDSTSLERSFNRSTAAANKFGRNVDSVAGRVDSRFTKLQRITAGGFVGGVAVAAGISALRSVVAASADAQQVLGQTKVALEATGNSWEQYGKQIESTVAAQSKLGFDDEALLRTFSLFVRTTGDVTQSLRLNALAADVARGRYIDLEQAATLVNKAAIGQSGALRRLGIDVKAGASAQELLTALTAKYGGAAQAASHDATTGFDRAKVSLENVQEAIGTGLLPTLADAAGALANTADKTAILITKLEKLGKLRIPTIEIPFTTIQVPGTGGTLGNIVEQWFRHASPAGLVFNTNDLVNFIAGQFDKTVQQAQPQLADKFEASLHSMIDGSLQAVAANDIVVDATKAPLNVTFSDLLVSVATPGFATGATPADILGPLITGLPIKIQQQLANAELSGKGIRAAHVKALKILTDAINDPRQKPKDRLALTQAAIAEQKAIEGIDTDAANAADSAAKDAASKRDARRTKAAQDRADAARKARERRQRIREREAKEAAREAKRLQTRQFRAIGLGPEGSEIVPRVENLRRQFQQLGANIEPGQLSSKLRKQFAGVGKLLRGDLGKVTEATREAINNLFKTIRSTFEQGGDQLKITPATTALNKNRIVEGLGLDRDTERIIKSRLSGFNAAGRRLSPSSGTTGAFGITISPQPIHVNTTVNLDGEKVARNTTIHQGKRARSNPAQKRGPLRGI